MEILQQWRDYVIRNREFEERLKKAILYSPEDFNKTFKNKKMEMIDKVESEIERIKAYVMDEYLVIEHTIFLPKKITLFYVYY